MNANWRPVYMGWDGDRPFKLEAYDDGECRAVRVETIYGRDQILANGVATVGLPVEANDVMRVEPEIMDNLEEELLANGFSQECAAKIALHAKMPWER